ncbi:MAG: CvpA family protein [Bacteroidota bacterium]
MVIDILFALVVLYGFYLGFSKGIIGTFFTFVSLTVGIVASLRLAPAMTKFLETTFANENPLMFLAGLTMSFIIIMLILRAISKFLEGILETANINIVNQFMGGVILSGVLVLLLSVLVWFGDKAQLIDEQTRRESRTYPYLIQYRSQARVIGQQIRPMFEEFWDQSINMMDRLEKISIEQTEKTEIEDRSDELPAPQPQDSPY